MELICVLQIISRLLLAFDSDCEVETPNLYKNKNKIGGEEEEEETFR